MELAQHAAAFSLVLQSKHKAESQCSEHLDMNENRSSAVGSFVDFCMGSLASLEQGVQESFEELANGWELACARERDRSALTIKHLPCSSASGPRVVISLALKNIT
jgi:hypothetical protein